MGSGEGPAGARGGRISSSHQRPLGLSCDPWDQPPSGSMDTSMRWSPSLSAVLSGGKVCSIQDLSPRRSPSVGETATPVTAESSWEYHCGSRQGARCSSVSLYLPYCVYQKTYGSCTCARLGVFCSSPFDGRPQGGGRLEPPARDSSGGCPGFIYPLGPGTFIRTDHFAQQPSAAAF